MSKIVLNDLQNLTNKVTAISTINNNNTLIEEAIEKTLSRDGTGPNEMEASLDMNTFPIYNLPKASADTEPVRKKEFDELEIAGDVTALLEAVSDAQEAAVTAVTAAEEAVEAAASINLPPVVANTMLVANPGGTARENKTFVEVATLLGLTDNSLFYNAVTDGNCDNTGATNTAADIVAAIHAAKAAGKTCYFPDGIYNCGGSTMTLDQNDCKVQCASINTVFRKTVDNLNRMFSITGQRFIWRGGRVTYTPATFTPSTSSAAFLVEGSGHRFYDLQIDGRFYLGHMIYGATDVRVENCRVIGVVNRAYYFSTIVHLGYANIHYLGCDAIGAEIAAPATAYTNYGFNLNGFGMGSAQGIFIDNCTVTYASAHGFGSSERIQNVNITNCNALYCPAGPGFLIQFANGYPNQRVIISNCMAFSCQIGFMANQASYVAITNCISTIATASGFYLLGCTVSNFSNNISENSAQFGFITDAGCANMLLTNNVAAGNTSGNYSISGTPTLDNNISV